MPLSPYAGVARVRLRPRRRSSAGPGRRAGAGRSHHGRGGGSVPAAPACPRPQCQLGPRGRREGRGRDGRAGGGGFLQRHHQRKLCTGLGDLASMRTPCSSPPASPPFQGRGGLSSIFVWASSNGGSTTTTVTGTSPASTRWWWAASWPVAPVRRELLRHPHHHLRQQDHQPGADRDAPRAQADAAPPALSRLPRALPAWGGRGGVTEMSAFDPKKHEGTRGERWLQSPNASQSCPQCQQRCRDPSLPRR